jgi:hypothetical protein
MSVIVVDELLRLGVPPDRLLAETTIGGDEIDVVADISGEITLFELKDKEFNLREAYSFGAKMGIVNPDHSVIITSEYVGGDAKEHFSRSREAQRRDRSDLPFSSRSSQSPIYVEGSQHIRQALENLITSIRRSDSMRELTTVLTRAALAASAILGAIEQSPPVDHSET